MIAKEGYTLVAIACVLALALVLIGLRTPMAARVLLFVGAAFVLGFTLYFFRDPERTPPPDAAALLLAPADGKVVLVEEVEEPLYLKGPARQVSIFLSPLNVHVNRAPTDGVVIGRTNLPLVHEGDALFHIVHVGGKQVVAETLDAFVPEEDYTEGLTAELAEEPFLP